ncbi:hypothetical protein AMTRI_Chr06g197430 [Amborella trichopoda]
MANQTWKVPTLSLKNHPISIPHFDPSFFYHVQDSSPVTLCLVCIRKSFDSEIHILQFIETTTLLSTTLSLSVFCVCSMDLQQHHFLV